MDLREFAGRYAKAWCSQDPETVAAFYAEHGSLSVNGGPPAIGRQAIADVARGFMNAFPDMEGRWMIWSADPTNPTEQLSTGR